MVLDQVMVDEMVRERADVKKVDVTVEKEDETEEKVVEMEDVAKVDATARMVDKMEEKVVEMEEKVDATRDSAVDWEVLRCEHVWRKTRLPVPLVFF